MKKENILIFKDVVKEYIMELNRIYNEDCLEGMKRIPDKSVDMILCDLPYGTTACKWDTIIPFEPLWEQYERIIKDNGVILLFASQPFTTKLIISNFELFKYCWYWIKKKPNGFQHAKNRPMMKVEEICVFSKASMGHESLLGERRMNYKPQGIVPNGKRKITGKEHGRMMGARPNQIGNEYESFTNFPNNVLEFDNIWGKSAIHPTQKPVELCEYLIKTYTNEGETVLDNCMGSGTTAVACINTNRNYIGFELDKHYCDIANERIRKALAEKEVSE